ncbi:S8 family serine peptidase [Candidatus Uhrbacteria bacterium]|nr:S8 family serine peptidase [Candidatus Uhrbacteria bacterium]
MKKLVAKLAMYALAMGLVFDFTGISLISAKSLAQVAAKKYGTGQLLLRLKGNPQIYKYKITGDLSELVNEYRQLPEVEIAELDQVYQATATPDDPFFTKQYYLNQVLAPDAWDRTQGSKNAIIAIIDSGVNISHPDLAANIWQNPREIPGDGIDNDNNGFIDDINGWDFVLDVPDPSPKALSTENLQRTEEPAPPAPKASATGFVQGSGGQVHQASGPIGLNHGTVVAGVAAGRGNNKEGIAGVCWNCKIMALRILDASGFGDTIDVVKGVDYAIANGASVINLSFVGFDVSPLMDEAMLKAYNSNVVVVAASGNDVANGGTNLDLSPGYPACSFVDTGKNVLLGVAALDQNDHKAKFSNYGSKCIDISAPGVNFFSSQAQINNLGLFDLYGEGWSGTSMATPLISGGAALIKSLKPTLTNKDIMDVLIKSADSVDAGNPDFAGKLGSGRLNLFRAVLMAADRKPESTGLTPSTSVGLGLPVTPLDNKSLVIVPAGSYSSDVHIYDLASLIVVKKFTAFTTKFAGGLNAVTGDIDGDGSDDILVAPGLGGPPQVKVFDNKGNFKFQFMAGPSNFRGGLSLALAPTKDKKQIVVGMGQGTSAAVKVFDSKGKQVKEFNAFPKDYRWGVNVASGNIYNDGKTYIVAATAGPGTLSRARVFDMTGKQLYEFIPFVNFKSGINLALADIKGDGNAELIFSPSNNGGPQIKIFNSQGRVLGQYAAFDPSLKGGLSLSTGDVLADIGDEIIAGTGKGVESKVRVFDSLGQPRIDFQPYPTTYKGGVRAYILNSKIYPK